jgi:hypothetical protein
VVLNVVCVPRHQQSHPIGAKKRQVQPQHVPKEALAQRVHDSLSGPFQHDDLEEIGDKGYRDDRQKNEGDVRDPVDARPDRRCIVQDKLVHGHLEQLRPGKTCPRYDKSKPHGQRHPFPLGRDKSKQSNYYFEITVKAVQLVVECYLLVIN